MTKRLQTTTSIVLLFVLLMMLSCYLVISNSVVAEAQVVTNATIDSNFTDDMVLVVLNTNATKKCKAYTVDDFPEIDCLRVDNLSLKTKQDAIEENDRQSLHITLKNKSKQNVLDACNMLMKRDDVRMACPNYIMDVALEQEGASNVQSRAVDVGTISINNSMYDSMLNVNEALSIASDNEILVGVIDSGVDFSHPGLINNVRSDLSHFVNYDGTLTAPTQDNVGHGTMVAGIIAGERNNESHYGGICPSAKIVSYDYVMYGAPNISIVALNSIITDAEENGIKILNWSGEILANGEQVVSLQEVIDGYNGLLVTIAANTEDGKNSLEDDTPPDFTGINIDTSANLYPAKLTCDNIIVVAGHNRSGTIYYQSNYGPISVDLFAPGESVVSAVPLNMCGSTCSNNSHVSNGYHHDSGTSFAAPYVAGVAALIWSKYPNLSASAVKERILSNVVTYAPLNGLCVTGGYLNAYKALNDCDDSHAFEDPSSPTSTGHKLTCPCGEETTELHTYSYSDVTNTTHKQTCTACSYNTVVPHLWMVTSRTVTGHIKQCACGHTVDELHTWVQNALGGYICSVCRQTGNFTPGVMPLLTPRGRIALQSANLQHGQVILIEGLQIIYFDGEYYLLTESAMDTPTPVPPDIETE